jgi:class 3 adenylate cyclase
MEAESRSAVEPSRGSSAVAVFGAPAAQENHAERALQTALWMLERLALRIGVNSGDVVVGRPRKGSSFATGDVVNVAGRLEQAAASGKVLVGRRRRSGVRVRGAGTVEANGKHEAVARPRKAVVAVDGG